MQETDKELLIRYFHGKCTSEEIVRAQALLQFPEAETFLRQLSLQEWGESALEDESLRAIHENWKKNVHDRISIVESGINKKNTPLRWLMPLYRYAAVLVGVVILVSGLLIWKTQKDGQQTVMVEKTNVQGAPVRYVLPDSSEIYLAAGSSISYPQDFKGKSRDVNLRGEAFFEVVHNEEQPFIVHTGEITTRDIGTSFRITDFPDKPLEIAVATGKVGVNNEHQTVATLTPGNKVTWYQNKATLGQVNVDALLQWKNGDLVFDRRDMAYIADELERRYGIHIVFADAEVKTNTVSGTFAAQKTAEQVMQTLALAGSFRYETKDNKAFTIYKAN